MKINADLTKRAEANTGDMEWEASPEPGVLRRMLDRDGGEVARCTTVVRFEPGARFPEHTHSGGEEFLVLSGVFTDEDGDYPAGTYVRHPVGTSHSAWSNGGCEILVKLMQMDAGEQERVVIDTNALDWVPSDLDGIDRLPLHEFASEKVWLSRFQPGAVAAEHDHPGGEEVFVLNGTIEDEDGVYPRGTWLRLPVGSRHHPRAPEGCRLYVKSGHLMDVRASED